MNHELLALTQEILRCRRCRTDASTFVQGHSVLARAWAPPRGWAGLHVKRHEICFVALNPGAPLDGELAGYESAGLGEDKLEVTAGQALAVDEFCRQQYRQPGRGSNWIFHRKSAALARALLWLLDGSDPGLAPLDRCWFTDALKCSTRKESAPEITDAAFQACRGFLERELRIIRPKLVVALGARASRRLQQAGIVAVHFRHPSNGCPRLQADSHDESFATAASLLGVRAPDSFREIRRQIHDESMAR
jgi:hypothetical protein